MTMQKVTYYLLNVPYYTIGRYQSITKLDSTHIDKKEGYIIKSVADVNKIIEQNRQNVKFIESLDGIKNVRFLPHVKFNRGLFKQMYPDINVRRLDGKADAIIYDSKNMLLSSNIQNSIYDNQSNLVVDYYLAYCLADKSMCNISSIDNIPIDWNAWQRTSYNKSFSVIETHHIDKAIEMFKVDLPYIDVSHVFTGAKTEMRKENLTLEDLRALYEQVSHKDMSIRRVGADILVSLDTSRYLPIQTLLWGACGLAMVKSHKTEVFAKYVQDLGIYIPNGMSQSNRSMGTFTSSPLYYINGFISNLNHNAYTESMEYQLLSDLVNKIMIDQIKSKALTGCPNLELDNFQIIFKHPKMSGVNLISANMSAEVSGHTPQEEPNEWIL